MTEIAKIGMCAICNRSRRLGPEGGCVDCIARFDVRMVPIAMRIRCDSRFRELCWRALSGRARDTFVEYFGPMDDLLLRFAPNGTRGCVLDGTGRA
jgi:hypothetical protein